MPSNSRNGKVPARLPKGWRAVTVGELVDLANGSAFNEKHWTDKGLPIIRIQNLNGSQVFNYFAGDMSRHICVMPGDLLYSWSGNRGTSFGPFVWSGPKGVLNQHIFKVTPKRQINTAFLYQSLVRITKNIEARAHGGTGIVHVRKSELQKFMLYIPPTNEQQRIADVLLSMDARIDSALAIMNQTRRLKEAIIEDLLSGTRLIERERSF